MTGLLDSISTRLAPGSGAAPELAARLASLAQAVEAGQGRVPERTLIGARSALKRAGQRMEHSTEHTVVALAGATGSGKSSLFNRLAGEQLAPVGVRRPTTSVPQACIWGPNAAGASSLLDWLGIEKRHVISTSGSGPLDGLVLLDLPDHDSTALAHRLEVDRLVQLVDLMVWVLDPQKYADAMLHRRYLAPLAKHGSVLMFALNHVDELSESQRDACLSDLRRLLADDGFDKPALLSTSATTGLGTDRLVAVLRDRVRKSRAASARLTADVERAASRLAVHGFDHPVTVAQTPSRALVDALASAAGVPAVSAAVATSHELRALARVGFPLTRWLGRLRPDPLRRLHLAERLTGQRTDPTTSGSTASGSGSASAGAELDAMVTARTSLPAPTPAQRARVDSAVRAEIGRATEGLTGQWKDAVVAAGRASEDDLTDALDTAVGKVDLPVGEQPRWWRVVSGLQWALLASAVVGGLWLIALAALGWLQIDVGSPNVLGIPVPTLLLVGGVLLGLLTAGVGRRAARVGGQRRGASAERALRTAVGDVAARLIVEPMSGELRRCADFTAAVAAARAPVRRKDAAAESVREAAVTAEPAAEDAMS